MNYGLSEIRFYIQEIQNTGAGFSSLACLGHEAWHVGGGRRGRSHHLSSENILKGQSHEIFAKNVRPHTVRFS